MSLKTIGLDVTTEILNALDRHVHVPLCFTTAKVMNKAFNDETGEHAPVLLLPVEIDMS